MPTDGLSGVFAVVIFHYYPLSPMGKKKDRLCTECVLPPNSYVEALTPNVTLFVDGTFTR